MSDMTDYERRISAALARIGAGLERLGQGRAPAPGGAADDAELREALEAERVVNAQLSERVRAIREKQETTLGALERKLAEARTEAEQQVREMLRLKRANADLIATNRALSEAGAGDGALVNRAMQAELGALRAERAADIAELDDIIAGLAPIIGAGTEADHA